MLIEVLFTCCNYIVMGFYRNGDTNTCDICKTTYKLYAQIPEFQDRIQMHIVALKNV